MDIDLVIDILEIYREGKITDRDKVLAELQKHRFDLDYTTYSTAIDKLILTRVLTESGQPNKYLYKDANNLLVKLKNEKTKRDKKAAKNEKTENIKNWKERNWLAIAIVSYFLGQITNSLIKFLEEKTIKDRTIFEIKLIKPDTIYINKDIRLKPDTTYFLKPDTTYKTKGE